MIILFYVLCGIAGGVIGTLVNIFTGYAALDNWQWWAICVPLVLITNYLLYKVILEKD